MRILRISNIPGWQYPTVALVPSTNTGVIKIPAKKNLLSSIAKEMVWILLEMGMVQAGRLT